MSEDMSGKIRNMDEEDLSQFQSILDQLPKATPDTVAIWLEDDYVPYTAYDAWRDRVKWRRVEFLRRIAPRV